VKSQTALCQATVLLNKVSLACLKQKVLIFKIEVLVLTCLRHWHLVKAGYCKKDWAVCSVFNQYVLPKVQKIWNEMPEDVTPSQSNTPFATSSKCGLSRRHYHL